MSDLQDAYATLYSGPTDSWILGDVPSGVTIPAVVGTNGTWNHGPALFAQPPLLGGTSDCVGLDFGDRGDLSADVSGGDVTWCWVSRDDRNDLRRHQWSGLFSSIIKGTFSPGGEFYGIGGRWTGAFYDGGAWTEVVDSSTSIDEDPHFWGLVHDQTNGELRLYQDGVLVGTYSGSLPTLSGGSNTIYLATYWDGGSGSFVGAMSDYAIWNGTAMTDDDMAFLAAAAGGGPEPPPDGQSSTVSWG